MTAKTKNYYRIFFSFVKEERWLEEMSAQGWHLVKAQGSLMYTFEEGSPEKRIYKIDYRTLRTEEALDEYLSLFEDSDWHCVNPQTKQSNYYFYTAAENEIQDIFSDQASKAQRFSRYSNVFVSSLIIPILPYFILYASRTIKFSELGYLTPGLWEMQGAEFASHFLFETPFVLMRLGCGLFPFFIILAALLFRLLAHLNYKKIANAAK